uniref:Uncharacterized protein n=1 Tax=Arundo donax TaxID=35708 RepID=A0A0A8YP30_ARUDO
MLAKASISGNNLLAQEFPTSCRNAEWKVHILDPRVGMLGAIDIIRYHEKMVKEVHDALASCMDSFFDEWKLDWEQCVPLATFSSNLHSSREESGFYTLFSICNFNGIKFMKEPTKEAIGVFKKEMLYAFLSLNDNLTKVPSVYVQKIDD